MDDVRNDMDDVRGQHGGALRVSVQAQRVRGHVAGIGRLVHSIAGCILSSLSRQRGCLSSAVAGLLSPGNSLHIRGRLVLLLPLPVVRPKFLFQLSFLPAGRGEHLIH